MPRKKRKPEDIVAKLRQVDVAAAQGVALAEEIRAIGVGEPTSQRCATSMGVVYLAQIMNLTRVIKKLANAFEAASRTDERVRRPLIILWIAGARMPF